MYIAEISTDSAAKTYLHQDNDGVISVGTIDVNSAPWKEDVRNAAICLSFSNFDYLCPQTGE